ncbi:unnamed protein product [Linum trigynum]|uniref:Cellulose synthase-like protein G3 n=1 Tax=Linum trigynum TaxID=586398 RepID=A0AAV2ELX3_9ROSI
MAINNVASAAAVPPLNTYRVVRRAYFNRLFAPIYFSAVAALFYNHFHNLLRHLSSSSPVAAVVPTLLLILADFIFALIWLTNQSFRYRPLIRREFVENVEKVSPPADFPAMDVFICTADPFKEPPIATANAALSVLAYDYPPEKLSVYVSDDGGSQLTMFAFMEAAKFAAHWLPFCRRNGVLDRHPEMFFGSCRADDPETQKIKVMYESMKTRAERVVEIGKVPQEYITEEFQREAFSKWTPDSTKHDHPTILQVLMQNNDKDTSGAPLPNLIYLAREKKKGVPHQFKAGAQNALLRVSAMITNSPLILMMDSDYISTDPITVRRILCYFLDPAIRPTLAYVQFPQIYMGLNKQDLYGNECKKWMHAGPHGGDGLDGPSCVGTGVFFARRCFYGSPRELSPIDFAEMNPDRVIEKPLTSQPPMDLINKVGGCHFEAQSKCQWGQKIGFRYGSLIEDYLTSFQMHMDGWKTVWCNPERPAFKGETPCTLVSLLVQIKRWGLGFLEVLYSKYCPLFIGIKNLGFLMGGAYSNWALWPLSSVPFTIYAFLPALALLHGVSIFPKVSADPWFLLYPFLFLAAYGYEMFEFCCLGSNPIKWWNAQRMFMIWCTSSFNFAHFEFWLKTILGRTTTSFGLTSKVNDAEHVRCYERGEFEFGAANPTILVPPTMAAVVSLVALVQGAAVEVGVKGRAWEEIGVQLFLCGFGVVNSLPFYKGMVRGDSLRLPTSTTVMASLFVVVLYAATYFVFKS